MNVGSLFKQGADKRGGYIGQGTRFSRLKGGKAPHAVGNLGDLRGNVLDPGVARCLIHVLPFLSEDLHYVVLITLMKDKLLVIG